MAYNIIKATLLSIIMLITYVLYSFGAFKTIEVRKETLGPYFVVYEIHSGDYLQIGIKMNELYEKLKKEEIEVGHGFGVFFDDPENVKEENLRSLAGYILDFENMRKLEKKNQFRVAEIPQSTGVYADFLLKANFSYVLGAKKVYPKIKDFAQKKMIKPRASLEIYDYNRNKIIYFFPDIDVSQKLEGLLN